MNKSKVILIGPTESVLTKRGNRFPNVADYLVNKGFELDYYTSNFYHAEKRFFDKVEISDVEKSVPYNLIVIKTLGYFNNVSVRRVFNNFFFSLSVFFKLLFNVKKGECIFLPSRPVELIFLMSLLKRIKKVKIVLDIQDVWPDALEIRNKKKKKIFETYCNFYLAPSLKYYDKTIHTAPSFKSWLERYALNTPSVFIPLGWENSRWIGISKKSHEEKLTKLQIVCVAQLQYQIDVMPMLKALKNIFNIQLTIIGEDGKGERYDEVINYIENNNMRNVTIIGKVSRGDMKNYFESVDIGFLPMITSSIPNKIFDYLAGELPILVLGNNDSSDFVLNNKIGWACNFNSEEIADVLLKITKKELNEKISQVKIVREDYSRDNLHKKIEKILV